MFRKKMPGNFSMASVFGTVFSAIILCLSSGCGSPTPIGMGKPGKFDAFYRAEMKGIEVPPLSAFDKAGETWTYSMPFEQVWEATFTVLSQYQGILALESTSSQRRLLAIKAIEQNRAPDNRARYATFGGFYEQWLAVAVVKEPGANGTDVIVASFDPYTKELRRSEGAALRLSSQIKIQLTSPSLWADKFTITQAERNGFKSIKRTEAVSQSSYRFAKLEQLLGDWIARCLKVELIAVECPETTAWLDGILDRLKKAANVTDLDTQVVVVASSKVNAFALPNGDVFVASGLLDSLDEEDEIAAVLAHELDHLVQHDVTERLERIQGAKAGAFTLRAAVGFGDLAIAMFAGSSGSLSSALARDFGRATLRAGGELGAEYLQTGMISNFSAETELRADVNGLKTLRAAGYDPNSNVRMLYALQNLEEQTLKKNETVLSNLINMRPGLDKRIVVMKKALADTDNLQD